MDQTLALMSDPYRFISKQCKKRATDAFSTRLLLRKTVCMTGQKAAEEVFYNPHLIMRKGAAPGMLKATLLASGGIQELDGRAHAHRKDMYMSIMSPENIHELGRIVTQKWTEKIPTWASQKNIVVYDELHTLLTEAVCLWAGIPLEEKEVKRRAVELTALFDSAGAKSIRHLWSRIARKDSNHWMRGIVKKLRANSTQVITPAQIILFHRDLNGKLLDDNTAAIEILNILRPVVAVSLYMVFCAHALTIHPESRERLENREEGYLDNFIAEVRRFYPFFPAMMARAKVDFEWHGVKFKKGMRVMQDNYGTNHDPLVWGNPKLFIPDRFKDTPVTPFNFIPQGGGDHYKHHRCPGEFITLELMKVAVEFFVFKLEYNLPVQDLSIDFVRTPALPRDRFIIDQVRLKDELEENFTTNQGLKKYEATTESSHFKT